VPDSFWPAFVFPDGGEVVVYIFEFIDKSPDDDHSVIVINGDMGAAIVGAAMTGYCSEDGARHALSILCVNPSRGEWCIKWIDSAHEDTLIGLHAKIAVGDIITRVPSSSTSAWDYQLKQIG
jgi:hypothetical protein